MLNLDHSTCLNIVMSVMSISVLTQISAQGTGNTTTNAPASTSNLPPAPTRPVPTSGYVVHSRLNAEYNKEVGDTLNIVMKLSFYGEVIYEDQSSPKDVPDLVIRANAGRATDMSKPESILYTCKFPKYEDKKWLAIKCDLNDQIHANYEGRINSQPIKTAVLEDMDSNLVTRTIPITITLPHMSILDHDTTFLAYWGTDEVSRSKLSVVLGDERSFSERVEECGGGQVERVFADDGRENSSDTWDLGHSGDMYRAVICPRIYRNIEWTFHVPRTQVTDTVLINVDSEGKCENSTASEKISAICALNASTRCIETTFRHDTPLERADTRGQVQLRVAGVFCGGPFREIRVFKAVSGDLTIVYAVALVIGALVIIYVITDITFFHANRQENIEENAGFRKLAKKNQA